MFYSLPFIYCIIFHSAHTVVKTSKPSNSSGTKKTAKPQTSGPGVTHGPHETHGPKGTQPHHEQHGPKETHAPHGPKGHAGCGAGKEPCEIDCEKGHKISSEGDKVVGELVVTKCSSQRFAKDISNSEAVSKQLSSLVNRQLEKKGVKEAVKIVFGKTVGTETQTVFHYSCNAKKEHQDEIKAALHAVCKDKQVNIRLLKER